jgi:hypothetical protein
VDQASLVGRDVEIEGQVVSALSRREIPVTAVDWAYVPQRESSQLVVVTPLYDSKGSRESYARIFEALSHAGIYQTVPIREIVVLSPQDPLAQELVRQLKAITEGALHITKSGDRGQPHYYVVFTPYLGKGGAIPSVKLRGEDDLRSFLESRVKVFPYIVDQALSQLAQKGSASIPHVQLTLRRAKKLNLAA